MKIKHITAVLFIFFSFSVQAEEKLVQELFEQANALYVQHNYYEAEKIYRQIADSGYSAPELYYNLGNACYRIQKYTDAIYYYEKAALLRPSDDDIRHNLNFAKLSIRTQIGESPDFFLLRVHNTIVNLHSSSRWALISIGAFVISLISIAYYLFSRTRQMKILSFTIGMFFLLGSISTFVFSQNRYALETGGSQAIVYTESVPLRSSPAETATILIRISAGHKVDIRDSSGDWVEVRLANGQVGWLPAQDIKLL